MELINLGILTFGIYNLNPAVENPQNASTKSAYFCYRQSQNVLWMRMLIVWNQYESIAFRVKSKLLFV